MKGKGTTIEDVQKTRVAFVTQKEIEMLIFKVFKLKDKQEQEILNSTYPRHPGPPEKV